MSLIVQWLRRTNKWSIKIYWTCYVYAFDTINIRSFCVNKWKLSLWRWLLPFAISINHLRLNWICSLFASIVNTNRIISSQIYFSLCVFVCANRNINTQCIRKVRAHPRPPTLEYIIYYFCIRLEIRWVYLHLMAFSICDSIAYFVVNVQCP